jgi:hypothetical protein
MSFDARERAMRMLAEQPRREIYEGAGPGGKQGSGLYYVTYSEGRSPTLNRSDIDRLLADGKITEKYQGCYVLREPHGGRT